MIIKNIKKLNRIIFFKNSQKNVIFNKNLHFKIILLCYILICYILILLNYNVIY